MVRSPSPGTGAPVVAVVNLKGGVGKSTLSLALAEAWAASGRSVILADADPQGSALSWSDLAAESGAPLSCTVVGLATADLGRRLPVLAAGADAVVIDTGPSSIPVADAAAGAAGLVLVPVPPRLADVQRAAVTVARAREVAAAVPVLVVLTMTRPTRALAAAASALAALGVSVAGSSLPLRESVAASYGRAVLPESVLGQFGVALLGDVLGALAPGRTGARRPGRTAAR